MSVRTAALAVVLSFASLCVAAAPGPRPELDSGACLSCHVSQLATLPAQPCISCHSGNMDFLQRHDDRGADASLWVMGAAGGGSLALLGLIGLARFRRLAPALAAAALSALAAPALNEHSSMPALPGWVTLAEGFACDLAPAFSPDGQGLLFARRGPDTNGDGMVDLRDGQALFLLRRDWAAPKRLTPYVLYAEPALAVWSAAGDLLAVPLPARGSEGPSIALFSSEGRRLSALPCEEPAMGLSFSPDGQALAFAEGKGIGAWTLADGARTWALTPLEGGSFPRLAGWNPFGGSPLFTRGYDYSRMGRTRDGRYHLPDEVLLETAQKGTSRPLTSPRSAALRRYKAQPVAGALFYLAQSRGGLPGLYRFDGMEEALWSREDQAVQGFLADGSEACWAWVSSGEGGARLLRFEGPGRFHEAGPVFQASLLTMAEDGAGGLWCSGAPMGGGLRRLLYVDERGRVSVPFENCGQVFGLAARAGSVAFVTVSRDTDGDGGITPMDRGELRVRWAAP